MTTLIRPEISKKHKYYINKHRHYELKHFCLQYPYWKETHKTFESVYYPASTICDIRTSNLPGDPTAKRAIMKAYYSERIDLIERTAKATDEHLHSYILKAVTEGLSYTYLKTKLGIPCSKDLYYDRYRRFFWLLDNSRKKHAPL